MAEIVVGTPDKRAAVGGELHRLRADHAAFVRSTNPALDFAPLADLAAGGRYSEYLDQDLLQTGLDRAQQALRQLGGGHLVPPDRAWVAISSISESDGFGGFHHGGQGYRHLQQVAILSLAGRLGYQGEPSILQLDRALVTLELLRSYFHDSIHYSTHRTYHFTHDAAVHRYQYGINFRKFNGLPYSCLDDPSDPSTRNLGIIMEAAADRFAQSLVRECTPAHYSAPLDSQDLPSIMWGDASGQLGETEISELESLARKPVLDEWPPGTRRFITNLCEFNRLVTLRYRTWLESLPWHQREQVHAEILGGMLTGKLRRLVATLDAVGSSRGMFKHYFKRSDF